MLIKRESPKTDFDRRSFSIISFDGISLQVTHFNWEFFFKLSGTLQSF